MAATTQFDDTYVCELSDQSKKICEKELNETEQERAGAVRALRQWVIEQPHLTSILDFKFLLRFLRAKKFSQLAARQTLENYWKARTETPAWFMNVDTTEPFIHELIDTGFYLIIPGTDSKGRKIIFERIGYLDVVKYKEKFGLDLIVKAIMALIDWVLMDENAQVNGLVMIEDMTDFSMSHHMQLFNTDVSKKLLDIYQNGYPCRSKGFHIYKEPAIFEPLMAIFKPFMKKKLRDRIRMHGQKLTSLYKETDKFMFPTEYLDDDYQGPSPGSVKDVLEYMKKEISSEPVRSHIRELSSGDYKMDVMHKPVEVEQASFRKLNVS